ncbi:MAG TPA: FAD-binding oxidoreductase [Solirubrobacteraceae bacterium]|nr:FAD-binding oxidoreductase [Solirubrobacteraceae bacterium]
MPSADLLTADPPSDIASRAARIHGWGGCRRVSVELLEPSTTEFLPEAVRRWRRAGRGVIARGMGRSYGDAAQLEGGLVVQMTRCRHFELDRTQGTVTAQAGVTLGELLGALVPAGWMLPVVPGTQHVSVAGAIASDIHGKNHARDGSFGSHVERLGLLTAGGEEVELSPGLSDGLFEATMGGMGLTGLILWARIRLRPVASPLMSVDTDRVSDLDGAFAALSLPGGAYRVAWLDLLGSPAGRGVVTRAEHVTQAAAEAAQAASPANGATVRSLLTVPEGWPQWPLRPGTVRAFNELRFRRSPKRQRDHVETIGAHLFPLDALHAWPRLYGPRGFLQYQLVVPYGEEDVIRKVIERLGRGRLPCYLAVLKDFGAAAGPPLSFPIPGWTLAMDIPSGVPGLADALSYFDELVAGCGGRVYLSKDVRLRSGVLQAMYPRLDEWRETRERADPDHLWRSDLGLRTGLIGGRAG